MREKRGILRTGAPSRERRLIDAVAVFWESAAAIGWGIVILGGGPLRGSGAAVALGSDDTRSESPLCLEPLAIDHEETWPAAALDLLQCRLNTLAAYEENQRHLDLMSLSQHLTAGRPTNPLKSQRDQIIEDVDRTICDQTLLGYHCTRLLPYEIEEIRNEGLLPLSPDLAERRIRRAEKKGYLPRKIATRLLAKSEAAARYRNGRLYFIFTKASLTVESGVVSLFANWGGEAVYYWYESDPDVGVCIGKSGVACIVEALIPAERLATRYALGERLTAAYLERRGIRTGRGPEMEGSIQEQAKVRRIIRRADPEFAHLTGCDGWRRPV